jgi:hypothetical protein
LQRAEAAERKERHVGGAGGGEFVDAPNILLIPGTSSVAHLRENLAAAELVLPDDAMAQLDLHGRGPPRRRRLQGLDDRCGRPDVHGGERGGGLSPGLAAAPLAQHPADPRHLVGGASARESGRGRAGARCATPDRTVDCSGLKPPSGKNGT